MILRTIDSASKVFGINVHSYVPITSKTAKIKCTNNNSYFVKETEFYANEKYDLLYNQGNNAFIFPKRNSKEKFVSRYNNQLYILSDYYQSINISDEYKSKYMINQLSNLHKSTEYKKVLTQEASRKKMEELYEYLQYKFTILESFVRSVECSEFDENSIMILKNYQYILDARKIMAKYNKQLIVDIKKNKSVYYSFIHNNPKLSHILMSNNGNYLVSIEQSKMGIPSLDIVKFYLYNESLNIDIKEIILDYFSKYDDDFYFNYFCFFVMVYYIKGIIIIDKEYVTSQSFVYAATKLNHFIKMFNLNE